MMQVGIAEIETTRPKKSGNGLANFRLAMSLIFLAAACFNLHESLVARKKVLQYSALIKETIEIQDKAEKALDYAIARNSPTNFIFDLWVNTNRFAVTNEVLLRPFESKPGMRKSKLDVDSFIFPPPEKRHAFWFEMPCPESRKDI